MYYVNSIIRKLFIQISTFENNLNKLLIFFCLYLFLNQTYFRYSKLISRMIRKKVKAICMIMRCSLYKFQTVLFLLVSNEILGMSKRD